MFKMQIFPHEFWYHQFYQFLVSSILSIFFSFIPCFRNHGWLYHFTELPPYERRDATLKEVVKLKASTHNEQSFTITKGVGSDFVNWMQSPWGGGKSMKEAKQVGRRSMKYLFSALGEGDNESEACEEYVDCVIASPNLLINFLKLIIEEWGLKAAAVIGYLQAISDLCDYRKSKGCSDSVLRSFAVTEVYIRKCKSTMHRRKNMEYNRDLSLETLIARNSWATLPEMEQVVPFHTDHFIQIVNKCREKLEEPSTADLVFATRFLCAFLFLRVKATRPMSIQFLTTDMIDLAHKNGGFVDATQFKTSKEFTFDSLKFSEASLIVMDKYINYVRPFCHPNPDCNYVLLTTKGTQYSAIGSAMSLIVHQAIGKHINPTRYRQIVETASRENLPVDQQQCLSDDQKHSSFVAKR